MKGIFGSMFDMDRDGQLNASEQAMEFMFLDHLTREDERKKEELLSRRIREEETNDDWFFRWK